MAKRCTPLALNIATDASSTLGRPLFILHIYYIHLESQSTSSNHIAQRFIIRSCNNQAMAGLTFLAAVISVPSLVSATATFSPNCSLPLESTAFVVSPNTRGTLDILWSGLFTIFICIWTVQHLNVPEQRDGRDRGWQGDAKWALRPFCTKVKWMLLTLILPEILLGKALSDLRTAKDAVNKAKRLKVTSGTGLSREEKGNWTLTHAYYADMGGFAFRTSSHRSDETHYKLQYILADDVLKLRALGHIAKLPSITEDEIKDKSQGDSFVKATAVLQVSWLVIQVILRVAHSLPVSQLEITACAFAACTFLTYSVWWSKPQGVSSCTIITLAGEATDAEAVLDETWGDAVSTLLFFWPFDHDTSRKADVPIRNNLCSLNIDLILGLTLGCFILGAVHCGAWFVSFRPFSFFLVLDLVIVSFVRVHHSDPILDNLKVLVCNTLIV
ncbi:hypothetical protein ONS95_005362 [Cadophora gregata]|uniref:uncharacterized protein n=1 Tax=Cadophora gregata TaxID=51156 RepID=UPI0026DD93DE|nr:uncharacterized protein ONS95_005362 [Cadophora gregata]KAK0103335.1 hypothetical protein ONS95_005362 [Cadophora gregata]